MTAAIVILIVIIVSITIYNVLPSLSHRGILEDVRKAHLHAIRASGAKKA